MKQENNTEIIKEADYPEINLRLMSNNIVYAKFKDNVTIDCDLQEVFLSRYNNFTEGKLMHFIFFAGENVSITSKARDNALKIEERSPLGATATIVNTLPYKLIANFYMKFNKPKRPFKVFSKEEEAIKWLKSIEL